MKTTTSLGTFTVVSVLSFVYAHGYNKSLELLITSLLVIGLASTWAFATFYIQFPHSAGLGYLIFITIFQAGLLGNMYFESDYGAKPLRLMDSAMLAVLTAGWALVLLLYVKERKPKESIKHRPYWPGGLDIVFPRSSIYPEISQLITRIKHNFPVPDVKPPFAQTSHRLPRFVDKASLKRLYDKLPNAYPREYERLGNPYRLDTTLYIAYAQTYLLSNSDTELGLSPEEAGLFIDFDPSKPPPLWLKQRYLWLYNGTIKPNQIESHFQMKLAALKERFGKCTPEQRSCLIDYVSIFSKANHGVYDEWVKFLREMDSEFIEP